MFRLLSGLLLALLLGLLTALCSTLSLALWMPLAMYPRQNSYIFIADHRPWNAVQRSHRGVWNIWWSQIDPSYVTPAPSPAQAAKDALKSLAGIAPPRDSDLPTTPEGWVEFLKNEREASGAKSVLREGRPAWGTFHTDLAPPAAISRGTDHGFGWPLPTLWYRVHGHTGLALSGSTLVPTAVGDAISGGHLLSGSPQLRGYTFRALPYRVHLFGLFLNTALFTAAWALLLLAPPALRRTLRRRRGHCIGCGYDMQGKTSTCPECGRSAVATH